MRQALCGHYAEPDSGGERQGWRVMLYAAPGTTS